MKNKFIILLLTTLLYFANLEKVLANDFTFNTETIEIVDNGNIILATNGVVELTKDKIKIISDNFLLNKKKSFLKANNATVKFVDRDLSVKADELNYNSELSTFLANGNVEIIDEKNKINLISNSISFNNNKNIISSETKSIINDKFGNRFKVESFNYSLSSNLIKINEAVLVDVNNNTFNLKKAFINLDSEKLIAKDISINFNNQYFQNSGDPRLKGVSLENNENQTIIKKGVFTPCKKNDTCPPWQLAAKEIIHDKKGRTIYYNNAWLKIYDKPVLYLPKFFHPDPTVKRQSGFLMPSFKISNSIGSSFNAPYYLAIANDKDITINPRFFSGDKIITQSEYRSVKANSKLNADVSLLSEKNSSSKNHFFLETSKILNFNNFSESNLSLNLQQTSNDTYLKTYKIDSPLINNPTFLSSSLDINMYREDFSLDVSAIVYEDLNKKNNDKYEFIYPTFNTNKKIINNSSIAGNFSVNSSGFMKHYDTNVSEKVLINDLIFNSDPFLTKTGFKNDFEILLKNANTEGKNSKKYKNTLNNELASIMKFNTSFPLKKNDKNFVNILKPLTSFKFSPNKNRSNIKNEDQRVDVNNIYNINRIGSRDTVEGGASLTYGLEFERNKLENNNDFFSAKLANVLRLKENKHLPNNNDLRKKSSDIFGSLMYTPSNLFKINYDFALDNGLDKTKYQSIETAINVNNFITSFQYLNENNTKDSLSYLSNKTTYNFSETNNLAFETRKNKKTNMTEFYNLIYQYKNDCLIAALEYNKDYYNDRDLKPEENIFFKLTIIPFGQTSSPNLR